MRAEERKGAWVLLIVIVVIGIFLWLLGRCDRDGSGNQEENNRFYSLDSRDSLDGRDSSNSRDSSNGLDSLNSLDRTGERSAETIKSGTTTEKSESKSTLRKDKKKRTGTKSRSGKGRSVRTKVSRQPMRDILGDTIGSY